MKQKHKMRKLLQRHEQVTEDQAKKRDINNPRQQVYFLRQDGDRIINTEKRTYKAL